MEQQPNRPKPFETALLIIISGVLVTIIWVLLGPYIKGYF